MLPAHMCRLCLSKAQHQVCSFCHIACLHIRRHCGVYGYHQSRFPGKHAVERNREHSGTWQAKGMTSESRSSLLGSGTSSHFFNLPSVSPVKEGKDTAESHRTGRTRQRGKEEPTLLTARLAQACWHSHNKRSWTRVWLTLTVLRPDEEGESHMKGSKGCSIHSELTCRQL